MEPATHRDLVSLGRGGLSVSRLGLGSAPFGGMFDKLEENDVHQVVNRALERGISYFDTAPLYGHGSSEKRLGAVLTSTRRDRFILSSKVGRILVPGEFTGESIFHNREPNIPVFDYTAGGIRKSVEDSLQRLGLESIDILYIHDPEEHMEQAIHDAYPELHRMREEGVVSSIGVGTNVTDTALRFTRDTEIDVVLLAGRYTALDQTALHEFLPEALRRNVSVVGAGVFNSGVLVTPSPSARFEYAPAPAEIIRKAVDINDIASHYGVPVESVGLQFPLRHPAVKAVIVGVRSVSELEANIDAFNITVPDSLWVDLEDAGLVLPVGHE